jgi:hypothetical protein
MSTNNDGNGTAKREKLVIEGDTVTVEFGWRTSEEVKAKAGKRRKVVTLDFSKLSHAELLTIATPWAVAQIQGNLKIIAENGGDLNVYDEVDVKTELLDATRKGGDKLAKAKTDLLQLGFSAEAIEALLASKVAAGEFN